MLSRRRHGSLVIVKLRPQRCEAVKSPALACKSSSKHHSPGHMWCFGYICQVDSSWFMTCPGSVAENGLVIQFEIKHTLHYLVLPTFLIRLATTAAVAPAKPPELV